MTNNHSRNSSHLKYLLLVLFVSLPCAEAGDVMSLHDVLEGSNFNYSLINAYKFRVDFNLTVDPSAIQSIADKKYFIPEEGIWKTIWDGLAAR